MKNVIKYKIWFGILFFLPLWMMVSCGDEHQYFPSLGSATGAKLKFFHGASDTVAVNFLVNGTLVSPAGGNAYASYFPVTGYTTYTPGDLNIKAEVPATDTTVAIPMATVALNGQNDQNKTIAFTGVTGSYEMFSIDDNISTIPFDGKAYVRLVNFIQDSPNGISLEMTNAAGTSVVATNVVYKGASTFVPVEPGTYSSIKILNAVGGGNLSSAASSRRTLIGNKIYTYYGRGLFAKPSIDWMFNR